MKLIIDIPEDALKEMKTKEFISIESIDTAIECIQNGIPLDDVKAEIETAIKNTPTDNDFAVCKSIGLEIALDILGNIGKAESEGE